MGQALAMDGYRKKAFLMTKCCARDYETAKKHLEDSLRRLQTDVIDLWQFHEINYDNDPDWIFDKGVLKAALEARKEGKVRYIGFTGHKDPRIHLRMLDKPFDWDTAQMPINVADASYRSFQKEVVPVCLEKGVGVVGMKGLGGGGVGQGVIPTGSGLTAAECYRYALSLPVSSQVMGLTSLDELKQAVAVARSFEPMSESKRAALVARVEEVSGDGRFELFKTTTTFDSATHRSQHGFRLETARLGESVAGSGGGRPVRGAVLLQARDDLLAEVLDEGRDVGLVLGDLERAVDRRPGVDEVDPEEAVDEPARVPQAVVHDDVDGHAPRAQHRLDPDGAEGTDLPVAAAVPLGEDEQPVGQLLRGAADRLDRAQAVALRVDHRAVEHADAGRDVGHEALVARAGDEGRREGLPQDGDLHDVEEALVVRDDGCRGAGGERALATEAGPAEVHQPERGARDELHVEADQGEALLPGRARRPGRSPGGEAG